MISVGSQLISVRAGDLDLDLSRGRNSLRERVLLAEQGNSLSLTYKYLERKEAHDLGRSRVRRFASDKLEVL